MACKIFIYVEAPNRDGPRQNVDSLVEGGAGAVESAQAYQDERNIAPLNLSSQNRELVLALPWRHRPAP